MATTPTSILSLRYGAATTISGSVASVALDANVAELFTLPTGFGDMLIELVHVGLGTFSGAYVAPAPAYDGPVFGIYGSDGVLKDIIGSMRWVHYGTASARPTLAAFIAPQWRVLIRQNERFYVNIPISAGAGVTGSVDIVARGVRLKQA